MSEKPMTDEILKDYLIGFTAEGELRGIDCCKEIRRLWEDNERERRIIRKAVNVAICELEKVR